MTIGTFFTTLLILGLIVSIGINLNLLFIFLGILLLALVAGAIAGLFNG